MKKSNFWKLLSGTVFFATVALASCVDDNDDKGMPYLEVTPDVLTFNADGAPEGASAFTVKSNRPWTLEVLEGSDWVTPPRLRARATAPSNSPSPRATWAVSPSSRST